jgi:hypothetical protein
MTDNNSLLNNSHAVASDCLFNMKPSSVNGRSYRCSIPPTNASSFNPSSMAVLYIPARRNCFLDPNQTYLRMTVQNTDTSNGNYFSLDALGSCFINRIDVFSGSNLLESTQAYNVLMNAIIDLNMNEATRTAASGMYGTSDIFSNIYAPRQGATVNKGCFLTVCIPVISGVFGMLAEKYLPLHGLADDIRIEISFESNDLAVCYNSAYAVAWKIVNVELEATIVELQQDGMSMINSVTPFDQPIYLHASTYRHFVSTLQASAGQQTFLVPARFASLKSLWVCPRRNTEVANLLAYSLSSRVNPMIQTYWWRIGSLLVPQKPVTLVNSNTTGGYAEGYAETMRALHSLNNASYGSSLGIATYQIADAADATVGDGGTNSGVQAVFTGANSYKNGFMIAQELETFCQRGDVLLSGMNTLGSQVFFECNIGTAPGSIYTLDFYAYSDCIYVLEGGLLSVRF